MRAFLGLEPSPQTKLAIQAWRNKALPTFEHPVAAANFHITLAFLGQISTQQQDKLEELINNLADISAFNVELDIVGYWPKPKALWLGCNNTTKQHQQLVNKLNTCAQQAGISLQKRPYQAHLTLVRKCTANPPAPLLPPNFGWQSQTFHLFESVSSPYGIVYPIRNTWKLAPNLFNLNSE
jgi:2'-5' RNA ligase